MKKIVKIEAIDYSCMRIRLNTKEMLMSILDFLKSGKDTVAKYGYMTGNGAGLISINLLDDAFDVMIAEGDEQLVAIATIAKDQGFKEIVFDCLSLDDISLKALTETLAKYFDIYQDVSIVSFSSDTKVTLDLRDDVEESESQPEEIPDDMKALLEDTTDPVLLAKIKEINALVHLANNLIKKIK